MSSVIPSAKYAFSGSGLRFWKGSTAIDLACASAAGSGPGGRDLVDLRLAARGLIGPGDAFELAGEGALRVLGVPFAGVRGRITSRRAEPREFTVTGSGEKLRDPDKGNSMEELEVTFRVRFPEGADGDRARDMLPRAIAQSHDRLCTVSRTVQLGTPIAMRED